MNHQEALASAPRRGATSAHPSGLGARLVCAAALLAGLAALALPAHAQYVWIDAKGMKQFSDRPPEASVPEKNILKSPGKAAPPTQDDGTMTATEEDSAKAKPKGPPTLGERNADFDKRRAEAAEKDKKTAEEAKRKSDQAANCQAARANQDALKSGMRLRTVDANGKQGIMTDAERAERSQKASANLANCN